MDTKLKSDITELTVAAELLKRGFKVLKPIGDRLSYDLAVDINGFLVRIQVKAAWDNEKKLMHLVDNRRTCTNRRRMKRKYYDVADFDVAILVNLESSSFYIMPIAVFVKYASSIAIVENKKRQRLPLSSKFRDRWDLITYPNLRPPLA
jgi:hypothetical protein